MRLDEVLREIIRDPSKGFRLLGRKGEGVFWVTQLADIAESMLYLGSGDYRVHPNSGGLYQQPAYSWPAPMFMLAEWEVVTREQVDNEVRERTQEEYRKRWPESVPG